MGKPLVALLTLELGTYAFNFDAFNKGPFLGKINGAVYWDALKSLWVYDPV